VNPRTFLVTDLDGDAAPDFVLNNSAEIQVGLNRSTAPWCDLGHALAGTHGLPTLVGTGTLEAHTPFSITLGNALANSTAIQAVGFQTLYFQTKGGIVVPDITPPGFFLPFATDASGSLAIAGSWPPGVPAGFRVLVQYWVADPLAPAGFAASTAISGTTR
jgi:hypothetical protein